MVSFLSVSVSIGSVFVCVHRSTELLCRTEFRVFCKPFSPFLSIDYIPFMRTIIKYNVCISSGILLQVLILRVEIFFVNIAELRFQVF